MSDLQFLESSSPPRNVVGDWAVRIAIAGAYVMFGLEKFPSEADSHWVKMFHQIGAGDWFRYFTGVVEVLGGLLVLIRRTALIGFVMLGTTMAGAAIIMAFVIGSPVAAIFPFGFLMAITGAAFWSQGNR